MFAEIATDQIENDRQTQNPGKHSHEIAEAFPGSHSALAGFVFDLTTVLGGPEDEKIKLPQ